MLQYTKAIGDDTKGCGRPVHTKDQYTCKTAAIGPDSNDLVFLRSFTFISDCWEG